MNRQELATLRDWLVAKKRRGAFTWRDLMSARRLCIWERGLHSGWHYHHHDGSGLIFSDRYYSSSP